MNSDSGDTIDGLIARGTLSANDDVTFRLHTEVARLFGKDYAGHQQATFRVDDDHQVWFPKLYKNSDWSNEWSSDARVITMRPLAGGIYSHRLESAAERRILITFGATKPQHYKFIGVFETVPRLSSGTKIDHQLLSDTIRFDGSGWYSYLADPARPELDDQVAEAAPRDLQQEREFDRQLDEGSFEVDDIRSEVTTRGSAQAAFARRVKKNYGGACAVTGITTPAFLVASHIVPWREDRSIRLDPTNGICLSTMVDRAYDAGILAITPDLVTAVRWDRVNEHDLALRSDLARLDGIELARPARDAPDPEKLARRQDLI